MKILMTSDTFLPEIGGAEIHVQNLIEQLSVNHEVILLTTETQASDFDHRYKVIRTAWGKRHIPKILKILWQESKDVDVIHCHYSYKLASLAGFIGRIRRIPVIVTLHGLGTLDQAHATPFYKWVHSIYRYLSLNFCTHIISTSQDLADVAYKHVSPKKISIILNGYDENLFNPNIVVSDDLVDKYKGKKIILTVRRLVPKNGIHFLVESLPFVIEKIPNIIHIMAGEGRMRDYIEKRVGDLNVEKHVEMLGSVDNKNIPQLLKIADVIVFPSTAESSSIACAEAMAMGKLIVSSRVGGLIELLGENNERGTLVDLVPWTGSDYAAPLTLDESKYQALAQAITDAIMTPRVGKEKLIASYAKENLSWPIISRKTEQIYRKYTKR